MQYKNLSLQYQERISEELFITMRTISKEALVKADQYLEENKEELSND